MDERYANWAGVIAVAASCCTCGVLAIMARKPSIVRGLAVAVWAAVAMGVMVVAAVGVEGELLGGGPPWGRVTPSVGVFVGMVIAGGECFELLCVANVVALRGGELARVFLVLVRCE